MVKTFLLLLVTVISFVNEVHASSFATTQNCSSSLNIRARASSQSEIVGRISCREQNQIEILGSQGSWYRVRYQGRVGYCFHRYLDLQPVVAAIENHLHSPEQFQPQNPTSHQGQECLVPENINPATINQEVHNAHRTESLLELVERNFQNLGGNPRALTQAMCFLENYRHQTFQSRASRYQDNGISITNERYITINDLTLPSDQFRLFVIDLETGEVKSYYSAHGAGRNPSQTQTSIQTSNTSGSQLSPSGFFITGERYRRRGDDWNVGLRLHGLERGINDNSYRRGIVLHGARYVASGMRSSLSQARFPAQEAVVNETSLGCTSVSHDYALELIDLLKDTSTHSRRGGSLYYNFSSVENELGDSFCGRRDRLLL